MIRPDQTGPDRTRPDQTGLDHTIPDQTGLDQTIPDQARLDQTIPDQTRPDQTRPDQTIPYQVRPDQTRPGQTRPGQTRPDQTRPDQTRSGQVLNPTTSHLAPRIPIPSSLPTSPSSTRTSSTQLQIGSLRSELRDCQKREAQARVLREAAEAELTHNQVFRAHRDLTVSDLHQPSLSLPRPHLGLEPPRGEPS